MIITNEKYTGTKKIDLDFIINSYAQAKAFQVRNPEELVKLPDTCSVKRIPLSKNGTPLFTSNTEYDIKLTKRIFNEMQMIHPIYLEIVPRQTFNLFYLIASDIIHPEVSKENLRLIQDSIIKSKVKGDISIADAQMMSYAIDRARQGKQTMLMSDDNHILKTISHLRKNSIEKEVFHENIFAFGIRKIIENFPRYQNDSALN